MSHGVAISALLAQLLKLDYRQAWASREIMHHNKAFTVLEVDAHTREVHAAQIAQSPHLT